MPDNPRVIQTIRNLDGALTDAARRKDATAFASYFAESAVQMPPNARPLKGRPAIRDAMAGLLDLGADLRFETLDVRVAEARDMAVSRGKYHLAMDTPDGPVKDEGSYLEVWQKIADNWKITLDIYHSDLPMG
jgi:uncharacterized protein (TIGR02246 family)